MRPNESGQELHAYAVLQEHTKYITFEPHLHAPGVRMCLEAIWGHNIQTLNCVGYDHNWVKQYVYDDDAAPLLPKGTIVHLIGFLDTTAANKNPADPQKLGGRRTALGRQHVHRPRLLGVAHRRAVPGGDGQAAHEHEEPQRLRHRLPALCWAPPTAVATQSTAAPGQGEAVSAE